MSMIGMSPAASYTPSKTTSRSCSSMRPSTSNRTSGRLFDNPSIRGLSLGALDPYVRRQVRGTRPTILFFSPAGRTVPDFLARWVNGKGLTIVPVPDAADVEQRVLRSLPQLVVIEIGRASCRERV